MLHCDFSTNTEQPAPTKDAIEQRLSNCIETFHQLLYVTGLLHEALALDAKYHSIHSQKEWHQSQQPQQLRSDALSRYKRAETLLRALKERWNHNYPTQ